MPENLVDNNLTSQNSNEVGAIKNNLPGRAMRVAMENKALLASKGQLYAGTGPTGNSIVVTGMDGTSVTYNIPKTAATPAPTTENTVLTYTGVGETGLEWKVANFGGPQTGPMGPTGPRGATGPTGATGPVGPTGPAGTGSTTALNYTTGGNIESKFNELEGRLSALESEVSEWENGVTVTLDQEGGISIDGTVWSQGWTKVHTTGIAGNPPEGAQSTWGTPDSFEPKIEFQRNGHFVFIQEFDIGSNDDSIWSSSGQLLNASNITLNLPEELVPAEEREITLSLRGYYLLSTPGVLGNRYSTESANITMTIHTDGTATISGSVTCPESVGFSIGQYWPGRITLPDTASAPYYDLNLPVQVNFQVEISVGSVSYGTIDTHYNKGGLFLKGLNTILTDAQSEGIITSYSISGYSPTIMVGGQTYAHGTGGNWYVVFENGEQYSLSDWAALSLTVEDGASYELKWIAS